MDEFEIIGHSRQIDSLKKSINNKNISHSYLFHGESGLGKKKVAKLFSKTLLCKEGGDTACNKCSSCLKFDNGNHPDFQIISDEDGLIKKEKVESVISGASTLPFESEKKIYLIDNSELMNVEGQNALLKTLEEPPEFLTIILISSNGNRLLPTILSRCQMIRFYQIENEKIVKHLVEKYAIDEEKALFLSEFTSGSLGRVIQILEDDAFMLRRDSVLEILEKLMSNSRVSTFSLVDFFEKNKDYIEEILDIMIYYFRDILVYGETQREELVLNRDKIEIISRQSHMEFSKIEDIIKNIEETKENIQGNINYILSIETMLLNIQEGTR